MAMESAFFTLKESLQERSLSLLCLNVLNAHISRRLTQFSRIASKTLLAAS